MFSARHTRKLSCVKALFKTLSPSSSTCGYEHCWLNSLSTIELSPDHQLGATSSFNNDHNQGIASAEVVTDISRELQVQRYMQFSTGTVCRACSTADRSSRLGYSSTIFGSRFAYTRPTNELQQRSWHSRSTISNKTYIKGKVHWQRSLDLRHAKVSFWEDLLTMLPTAAPVAGSSWSSYKQSSFNCCYPITLSRKLLCPSKPCHVEHAVFRSSSGDLSSCSACVILICPF